MGWDPSLLTAVDLTINDVAGNELQAATEASLYTATTLEADANRYSRNIVLADESEDLEIGDRIRIIGIQGYEDHIVKGYDSTTLTAILEEILDRDFEACALVYRLSAISTVDLSDTDVFAPGIQIVLIWTPTGTGSPFTELAEVEGYDQIDLPSFVDDLRIIYPRVYDAFTKPANRLGRVIQIANDQLRIALASRGLDIARIKDSRLLTAPMLDLVASLWTKSGDVNTEDERKQINKSYSESFEALTRHPIWVDADGDGIQDDTEVQDYPYFFERTW